MKTALLHASAGAALALAAGAAHAQSPQPTAVLIENVRIFNGTSERLSAPSNVLVVGNAIKAISTAPIAAPENAAVTRIAGGGRTLMPGLIDAHTHVMFATLPQAQVLTGDIGFVNVAAVKAANDMLMRGFTVDPRPGRPGVRAEARHRHGTGSGAAHLGVRLVRVAIRWAWRLSPAQ